MATTKKPAARKRPAAKPKKPVAPPFAFRGTDGSCMAPVSAAITVAASTTIFDPAQDPK